MNQGDAQIRAALTRLGRLASSSDIPATTGVPWAWLAAACRTTTSGSPTERIAPHSIALCDWWRRISPSLTPLDYHDLGFSGLSDEAHGEILAAALPVLEHMGGVGLDQFAGTGLMSTGQLKGFGIGALVDLVSRGVHVDDRARAFAARPNALIDPALLSSLAAYARGEFAPLDPDIVPALEAELEVAKRFAHFGDDFVKALVGAASTPSWHAVGAERALLTVTPIGGTSESLRPLLDAAVAHLRARLIPPIMLSGVEWNRWLDIRAERESRNEPTDWWVPAAEPQPGSHDLRPLSDGESRHVLTLDHSPESNMYFVRRDGDKYIWENDRPWSIDDPRRVRSETSRSSSLWALYLEMGRSLGMRPAWTTEDFAPFDGLPRPDLSA